MRGVKLHRQRDKLKQNAEKKQNDTDFHENDSTAPRSVVERARLTNEAIRIQTEIVERNLPGTEPLYMIANRFYGRTTAWKAIREANKEIIGMDGRVRAGQTIKLPR